jgi:hypothetical protein
MRGQDVVCNVRLNAPDIIAGKVVLGIYTERDAAKNGPYMVAFNDVRIAGLR